MSNDLGRSGVINWILVDGSLDCPD